MITITMLTKNSERTIKKVLNSVKDFDEIIILDTGSNDKTIDIASTYPNVKIYKTKFTNFGELKNLAAKKAKNNWILALDSDEEISKELNEELKNLTLNSTCIYDIGFFNFYNNKHIKHCGWHPEYHIRLYNKDQTQFNTKHVHEHVLEKNLKTIRLRNKIYHYSYLNIDDFLHKMQKYSSLFVKQHIGRKSSFSKAFFHSLFAFFKSFILKKGFLSGKEGFIISVYNANTAFYKYLKLAEKNNVV